MGNKAATFSFLDKVFGAHIPLLAEEGCPRHQKNGSVPICRGRGGQFDTPSKASRTDHYYGFALSRSRFAYYGFALSRSRFAYYGFALSRSRFAPVCAAFVASRHFLDGAATPLRGGECILI